MACITPAWSSHILSLKRYVMQCLMTKQASQRDERKRTHLNANRNKRYCFQYAAPTFFNNWNRASSRLTNFNTKSVCCFSPLQTLSLIYHLFSFPRTHFPLIVFKPTDKKDSFCLLPLVFDRVYKRLLLILCKDITLIMRFLFFFFFYRRRIVFIRARLTRSADFSYPLQRQYSVNAFVL